MKLSWYFRRLLVSSAHHILHRSQNERICETAVGLPRGKVSVLAVNGETTQALTRGFATSLDTTPLQSALHGWLA